jgi:hypothetical protein
MERLSVEVDQAVAPPPSAEISALQVTLPAASVVNLPPFESAEQSKAEKRMFAEVTASAEVVAFVAVNLVAKKLLVVALVPVALVKVKDWSVLEESAKILAKVAVLVKVGASAKTRAPDPVSSPMRPARSAEVPRDVEASLSLKMVQSLEVRQPVVPEVALVQVSTPAAFERPVPVRSVKVSLLRPIEVAYRAVVVAVVAVKFVVVALVKKPLVARRSAL